MIRLVCLLIFSFSVFSQDSITMYGKMKILEGDKVIIELKSGEKILGNKSVFINFNYEKIDFQYFEISKNDLSNISLSK